MSRRTLADALARERAYHERLLFAPHTARDVWGIDHSVWSMEPAPRGDILSSELAAIRCVAYGLGRSPNENLLERLAQVLQREAGHGLSPHVAVRIAAVATC